MQAIISLYRPVGLTEMKLILDSELQAFPPRLPEQPIFYPVLNKAYADQIAAEWNTKDRFSGFVGFVTEFKLLSSFANRYKKQIVGAKKHEELWIPAEELEEMNRNIEKGIQVIDVFYGKEYQGLSADSELFAQKSLPEQFRIWHDLCENDSSMFRSEVLKQWKSILMNYKFWAQSELLSQTINEQTKNKVLLEMQICWHEQFPGISLPLV